jgi:hypothetical protein
MAFTAVDAYDRLIGATRRRSPSACSTLRGVWPGQRVLDLGCGPVGRRLRWPLPSARLTPS